MNVNRFRNCLAFDHFVLLLEVIHGEINSFQIAARGGSQITWFHGTACEAYRVEIIQKLLFSNVFPNFDVGFKQDAFLDEQINAPVDDPFV